MADWERAAGVEVFCPARLLPHLEVRTSARKSRKELIMLNYVAKLQTRIATRDRGATAVEYGLMVALIAIVIIAAVTLLGGNLRGLFNNVATSV
jgi:pilus assembly protein Flp/PilA